MSRRSSDDSSRRGPGKGPRRDPLTDPRPEWHPARRTNSRMLPPADAPKERSEPPRPGFRSEKAKKLAAERAAAKAAKTAAHLAALKAAQDAARLARTGTRTGAFAPGGRAVDAPPLDVRPFDAFAITAPGLAPRCAAELRALGIVPRAVEDAGVAFDATPEQLWRANLWLRTASRVIVRLAQFEARSFAELEKRAAGVDWARVAPWDAPTAPRLRVTCRKSRLYHSDAVAERVARAWAQHVGGDGQWTAGAEDEDAPEGDEAPLLVVRFVHDRCTISADASGALLHRRGWRQAVAKAPLRETLAAGMLLSVGYDGSAPLLDPCCGSGTIAIEAALLARRLAPGRHRSFAFERWPSFDPAAWRALLAEADAAALPRAPHPIVASDRDAGAVEAARANAERAGVAADVDVRHAPLSAVEPPAGDRGWLVTNPPYGKRVGDAEALGALWTRLGQYGAQRVPGWTLGVLAADARLAGTLETSYGAALDVALATSNGGLPVRVLTNGSGASAG